MSERLMTVYEAIPLVIKELGAIPRDQINKGQGFKFRGVDDLYNQLSPLLAKHGCFMVPIVDEVHIEPVVSKQGAKGFQIFSKVRYRVYGPDGSFVEGRVTGEGVDYGDKASNKAMSIAHKYAITQIFCVRTEDQSGDDADANTPPKREADKPPQKTAEKPTPSKKLVGEESIKKIVELANKKGTQISISPDTTIEEAKVIWQGLQGLPDKELKKLPTRKLISEAQLKRLWAIGNEMKWDNDHIHDFIGKEFGLESTKELDVQQYNQLIAAMSK